MKDASASAGRFLVLSLLLVVPCSCGHAACPPALTVSLDWSNSSEGSKTPLCPGEVVHFSILVSNPDMSDTATNVIVVDTLPTPSAWVRLVTVPSGWVSNLTLSGTGGQLLALFFKESMAPGESATLAVDMMVTGNITATYLLDASSASCTGFCVSSPSWSAVSSAYVPLTLCAFGDNFGGVRLQVRVFAANGSLVRAFATVKVGRALTQVRFTYTAAGTCTSWTSDPTQPFSPDGDCRNDILKFTFDELPMPNGQPFDAIWWDGRDDSGVLVPCGNYTAYIGAIDQLSGYEVHTEAPITVACLTGQGPGSSQVRSGRNGTVDLGRGERATFAVKATGTGDVQVLIYDQRGTRVKEITGRADGSREVVMTWDCNDTAGRPVPPGVYSVAIKAPGVRKHERIVVVR